MRPNMGSLFNGASNDKIATWYYLSWFIDQVLSKMQGDKAKKEAERMMDANRQDAFAFIKMIEGEYTTLIASLQLSSARRVILNHERSLIWKMQHEGVLEDAEAQKLIDVIEDKMRGNR